MVRVLNDDHEAEGEWIRIFLIETLIGLEYMMRLRIFDDKDAMQRTGVIILKGSFGEEAVATAQTMQFEVMTGFFLHTNSKAICPWCRDMLV